MLVFIQIMLKLYFPRWWFKPYFQLSKRCSTIKS